jgi:hypothetical protein
MGYNSIPTHYRLGQSRGRKLLCVQQPQLDQTVDLSLVQQYTSLGKALSLAGEMLGMVVAKFCDFKQCPSWDRDSTFELAYI